MKKKTSARPTWSTREAGAWKGTVRLFERETAITVAARDERTRDARFDDARARLPAILETVVIKMLELYEDSWIDGGDVGKRVRKVTLRAVDVEAKGKLSLTLTDGGLFAGHMVLAHVTAAGRVRIDLAG